MSRSRTVRSAAAAVLALGVALIVFLPAQESFKAPETVLPEPVLRLILNEVSGQQAFNNEVVLAGVQRVRTPEEMTTCMYEAAALHGILKGYGLDELTLEGLSLMERATWWVGHDAELGLVSPGPELLARLSDQPALMIRGCDTVDGQGELVYLDQRDVASFGEMDLKGKIILTPEYPGRFAPAFEKGALGIITYENSIDPLGDPDQVMYDMRLDRGRTKAKVFGFRISARLGGRLRDLVLQGAKPVVRVRTKTAEYPWRADTVFAAIKGTAPEKKGLMFTAHLFERPVKTGANDNVSGSVVLAEVARTLAALVRDGRVPRPERSIYFLWSEEGSGTAAYFKKHPEMASWLLGNINMDMVGEDLDRNSAFFNIESPLYSKATYLDAAALSLAEYVFRTNVERHGVFGPTPGERFPVPIVEKNGSKQSFKYLPQRFGGGSDHANFVESDEPIPALMFIVWPDKWYHTDHDTPDKSDPTQLKRAAFIGAAAALAVCSADEAAVRSLARTAFTHRLRFIADAFDEALGAVSARSAADGGRALSNGLNGLAQSVAVSNTALLSLKELGGGRPALAAYIDGLAGEIERTLPFYTDRLKSQSAIASRAAGLKPEPPWSDPDRRTLETMVPVKAKRTGLGDFFPFQEIFGSLGQDRELQAIAFQKLGASGLIEMFIMMDGRRTLASIRDLLSFEFAPVDGADILKLAKAFEAAKLLSFPKAK